MLYKQLDAVEIEYAEAEIQTCPNGQCSLVKTASERPDIFNDITIKKNHAYLYVIAMGAGDFYGPNKNGDFFWEKDLKDYYKKFLTSGVFIQHDNKDPNKSIGKVLKAIYNDEMHRVELVIEIKKELAPDIYTSINNGERISVSMGTKVVEESCSYCGHITKDSLANRCDHLKYMMHKIMPNGVKVAAINHPPLNFFDISIVRRPADTQGYALFQKVASEEVDSHPLLKQAPNSSAISLVSIAQQGNNYGLDKEADLIKRTEAWAVTNPLKFKDIQELRRTPYDLLANFLKSNNILLRPSEYVAYGMPNISEDMYNHMCNTIDNQDGLMALLKIIKEKSNTFSPYRTTSIRIIKVANEGNNELFNKLLGREMLIKEAQHRTNDVFGHKNLIMHNKKSDKKWLFDEYAGYQLNLNNGDAIYTNVPTFADTFGQFYDTGAIESVFGILPNGATRLVYKGA